MKKCLLGSVGLLTLFASSAASAADIPAPVYKAPVAVPLPLSKWFVEGRAGGAFGNFNDFRFQNPVGAGPANLNIGGNFVPLNNRNVSDTSWTAGASVGYFFTPNVFGKVSYQYFGKLRASGNADFTPIGAGIFRQDLTTSANTVMVGLGFDYDITKQIFVEPTAELGVGFLSSKGVQGANLGTPVNFPSGNRTNFVGGGGLGLGYHATSQVDFLINGNYYYLGKADTGVTGNPPPAGMNVGEQLQAKLSVISLTAGARMKF